MKKFTAFLICAFIACFCLEAAEKTPDICKVIFKNGTENSYQFGNDFPIGEGSLEIRFKPLFPQDAKQKKIVLLTLSGNNTKIELYYKPNGRCWIFKFTSGKWLREVTLWHGIVKEGKWNNVLLTWNRNKKPQGKFNVYLNGKWNNRTVYDRKTLNPPNKLEITVDQSQKVEIGDLLIYGREFTAGQAKVLSESLNSQQKENRFAKFAAKLEEDEKIIAERKTMVGQLKGKIGYLLHHRRNKSKTAKLPEDIIAEAINPGDIGKIDLSKFKVIFFPKGPRFELKPEQYKYIVDYVKNGGGYVGSCQGSFLAHEMKLLDSKAYTANVWGIFAITLKPSPINDWQKGQIHMHFGNGPIMVPGKDCEIAAYYVMSLPGKITPAAIVSTVNGKGRIVLFGPHPTGGKVSRKGTRAYFSGKDLGTERMLVNALIYAARICDFPEKK